MKTQLGIHIDARHDQRNIKHPFRVGIHVRDRELTDKGIKQIIVCQRDRNLPFGTTRPTFGVDIDFCEIQALAGGRIGKIRAGSFKRHRRRAVAGLQNTFGDVQRGIQTAQRPLDVQIPAQRARNRRTDGIEPCQRRTLRCDILGRKIGHRNSEAQIALTDLAFCAKRNSRNARAAGQKRQIAVQAQGTVASGNRNPTAIRCPSAPRATVFISQGHCIGFDLIQLCEPWIGEPRVDLSDQRRQIGAVDRTGIARKGKFAIRATLKRQEHTGDRCVDQRNFTAQQRQWRDCN